MLFFQIKFVLKIIVGLVLLIAIPVTVVSLWRHFSAEPPVAIPNEVVDESPYTPTPEQNRQTLTEALEKEDPSDFTLKEQTEMVDSITVDEQSAVELTEQERQEILNNL